MIDAYVLIKPVITEKSLQLASKQNIYTFKVTPSATKPQIAQAVRELYGVEVKKVRTVMNQAESRRTGRKRLKASTTKTKKALVQLKEGDKIEIFDIDA